MKVTLTVTLLLFANFTYAQSTNNKKADLRKNEDSPVRKLGTLELSSPLQQPGLYIIPTESGEVQYAIKDTHGTKIVSASIFASTTEDTLKKVKEVVCGFSLKPAAVDISMGFASASWDVKELCK